jgi:hypothetical protein
VLGCFVNGKVFSAIALFDGTTKEDGKILIVYNVKIKICISKECICHQLGNISTIHDFVLLDYPKFHVFLINKT